MKLQLPPPPPMPLILLLMPLILHLFLHHIHSRPHPAPCALMMMLSHSSLTPMTLSSHLISLIHPIQTPHSSRSAATSTANSSTLKPCVSYTKPIHPRPPSTKLSTSFIAYAPRAASCSCSAPSLNLQLTYSFSFTSSSLAAPLSHPHRMFFLRILLKHLREWPVISDFPNKREKSKHFLVQFSD